MYYAKGPVHISYKPITRMVIRVFKYIFEDKDKLIETFIISVDEMEFEVSKEDFNRYINTILLYFSSYALFTYDLIDK